MMNNTRFRLGILAALVGGLLSAGAVIMILGSPDSLITGFQGLGLSIVVGLLTLVLRRRSLWLGRRIIAIAILVVLLLQFALPRVPAPTGSIVHAASITVTTFNDIVDANGGVCAGMTDADLPGGDGVVSLREAICAANGTAGDDDITLGVGTYNLTITNVLTNENASATGDLDITGVDRLTIVGQGSNQTIIDAGSAGGINDRIFHVLNGSGAVQISALTIQNGLSPITNTVSGGGGAIRNEAALTLDDVQILSNISDYDGGGLNNQASGVLIMTDVTLDNNTGRFGGGLLNSGQANLDRVTISNNSSIGDSSLGGSGGGIRNDGGVMIASNVTISRNFVDGGPGGGIRNFNAGTVDLTNVTIVENRVTGPTFNVGSGIRHSGGGSFSLRSTLIANNIGANNCNGFLTDAGGNLDGGSSCGFPAANSNLNPWIGPLQLNPPGATETHALLAGSPAVDAGNQATCPVADQRGQTRVDQPGVGGAGVTCDIGAYEFSPIIAVPNLNLTDAITVIEGDSGTVSSIFTATLDASNTATVTVDYSTGGGDATPGDDYVAATGVLTFAVNDTVETIAVTVNGDTNIEMDEAFNLTLSNASWATIADGVGQGTITNDDLPKLSIDDIMLSEGDSGTSIAVFTVTLSNAGLTTATVNYQTQDDTATVADNDYILASGVLTFAPSDTLETISVVVNGDTTQEPNETFFVNLSGPAAADITDGQGIGTIINDDGDFHYYLPLVNKNQ